LWDEDKPCSPHWCVVESVPGLRDARAPLIAGYLWLLDVWLLDVWLLLGHFANSRDDPAVDLFAFGHAKNPSLDNYRRPGGQSERPGEGYLP
jgi:hypothetical protein